MEETIPQIIATNELGHERTWSGTNLVRNELGQERTWSGTNLVMNELGQERTWSGTNLVRKELVGNSEAISTCRNASNPNYRDASKTAEVSRPRERFMQQITTQNIVGKRVGDDLAAIDDCGSTAACAGNVLVRGAAMASARDYRVGGFAIASKTIVLAQLLSQYSNYRVGGIAMARGKREMPRCSMSWRQVFMFDRYGNRNFDEASTTTLPRDCVEAGNPVVCESVRPMVNPSVNPLNNRFSTGQGWSYDAAGNVTADPEGRQFIYDAENKQVKVETFDASGNPINTLGVYFYDGDGKRVKKVVPATGETTIFVYDASGRLVAEYSTIVTNSTDAKVAYLTNDHLGSPRINTDANGNVTARHDYHPFGEEIGALAAVPSSPQPRTAALGYTTDTIRRQFTGYERDNEIEMDFAEARYYKPMHGRFTLPDPLLASAKAENPQSWNRYIYVGNNPLVITDPTGLKWYYNSAEDRYKWYGDNDKVDDGFVPIVGTVGADERGVGSFVYETENGWVRLNPYENSFAIFDTREAARGDFESVYQCNCQGLAETIADESVRKVTTVGIAAGVAVAVGTGAGVAMAGRARRSAEPSRHSA